MMARDLEKEILEWIRQGLLKPGSKVPSERELSLKTGLARGTVARALRELERKGFLETVRGKGRFVKEKREKPRTMTVGIVFWDIAHSSHLVSVEALRGVEALLSKDGYRIIIYSAKKPPSLKREEFLFNVVPPDRVDGLVAGAQEFSREDILKAKDSLPIVGWNLEPSLGIPVVVADYVRVGFEAVEYLVAKGHREIALLNAWETFPISRYLEDGYRLALGKSGIPYKSSLIRRGYYDVESGYYAFKSLLEAGERPTAVICGDDAIAVGAMRAGKEAGLKIPEDLAVIGCNDVPLARFVEPPLTTFRISFFDLGFKSAEMLLSLIKGEEIPEEVVYIPPTLVVRESA